MVSDIMKSITFLLPKAPKAQKFQWQLHKFQWQQKVTLAVLSHIWCNMGLFKQMFLKIILSESVAQFYLQLVYKFHMYLLRTVREKNIQFCFSILFLRIDFHIFMGKTNKEITLSLKCSICTKKWENVYFGLQLYFFLVKMG